ncbi:hypothetical protein RvY_15386 [Ramazzottius varieornatus]|uniref:Tetraspanin n=1 Tax=Ramazzottius varieornatus TaxID=947166 RepID=A0A1D1W2S1_RAMVA|nr:hypothetical protein RvY_15386 [Ramazzottius varieornatus]
MGLNCGAKFAKYVLFLFNFIFFLGGAAVLGVGIWVVVDSGSYMNFLSIVDASGQSTTVASNILTDNVAYVKTLGYVAIGIGSFVFLVGFMGCCGACKEWRPLLIGYAICLIIIICAQIGLGIAFGVYKQPVQDQIIRELRVWNKDYSGVDTQSDNGKLIITGQTKRAAFGNMWTQNETLATNGLNSLQMWLGCCGIEEGSNGQPNFAGTQYELRDRNFVKPSTMQPKIPVFCCKMEDPLQLKLGKYNTCFTTPDDFNSNKNIGCVRRVEDFVNGNMPLVIGVMVGVGLVELIGVVMAFCLCGAISDKRH